jgi:excisionase family DNA binding protein
MVIQDKTTISVQEACVRLHKSHFTIWSWIRDGRLRVIRPGPRCTRVLVESVEALERKLGVKT